MKAKQLDEQLARVQAVRHSDPSTVLGRHPVDGGGRVLVRVFLPPAKELRIADTDIVLQRIGHTDLFQWQGPAEALPRCYRLIWTDARGQRRITHDPYCFPRQLSDFDLHLFAEGRHWHTYRFLGAHPRVIDGVAGVLFAVWAPSAERVSVVGDFNSWDGRIHAMRLHPDRGVWELFVPGVDTGVAYRYELLTRNGEVTTRNDPYGNWFRLQPEPASRVTTEREYLWHDEEWLAYHRAADWASSAVSIYQLHLGSWQRDADKGFLNYREIAERLAEYARDLGFTHVALLPITEHPDYASLGYDATGFFAPSSRFGDPNDFRYFVDLLHQHGVGVILDWTAAHFPRPRDALALFDGDLLYERSEAPRDGQPASATSEFDYGRNQVRGLLLSSALYWLQEFHIDGLRMAGITPMLYLDHGRSAGEWIPNRFGGRENLEAVEFLRQLNNAAAEQHPGVLMIAEESSNWPQLSRPAWLGGLGFSMKWNLGWLNDTLAYLTKDPVYRRYHHDLLTFGLLYAFQEDFVLPLPHADLASERSSLLARMPGDRWQQLASVRLLFTYMFTYPGKKLLFMGSEFAQLAPWDPNDALDWELNGVPQHAGVHRLVCDLNRLYRNHPALRLDFDPQGFEWIDCHDSPQSVLSYLRRGSRGEATVVVLNFTPVPREEYRIGLPGPGRYREIVNSDSAYYGGSNFGNGGGILAEARPWMNREFSASLRLPPLGAVVLVPE